MPKLKLKHLVAIRWFHWINFPLLFLMIWSGILIYWAYDVYHIGPLHFFPQWVFHALNLSQRLPDGMAMHFVFMWLFVINGILYVAYTIFSGEWRLLVPQSLSVFRDSSQVFLHDLGFPIPMPPQDKYNAAQQLSYTGIVLMGVLSVITGFAIYKPAQLGWLDTLLGGYKMARLIHFALTMGYVAFFVVHIAQVVRAGWNNFRSMMIGYELVEDHEK